MRAEDSEEEGSTETVTQSLRVASRANWPSAIPRECSKYCCLKARRRCSERDLRRDYTKQTQMLAFVLKTQWKNKAAQEVSRVDTYYFMFLCWGSGFAPQMKQSSQPTN